MNVRECGGTVNTAITIAGAKSLLKKQDRTRLKEYAGLFQSLGQVPFVKNGLVK